MGGRTRYYRRSIHMEGTKVALARCCYNEYADKSVQGIIPALIGNIIGGGLFVGVWYWYLHLSSNGPVSIDGLYYEPAQINGHEDKGIMSGLSGNGFSLRGSKSIKSDEEKAVAAGEEHGG